MTLLLGDKEVTKVMIGTNVIYEKEKWESIVYKIENSTGTVADVPGNFMYVNGIIIFKSQNLNILNDNSDSGKKRLLATLPPQFSNISVLTCGTQNGSHTNNSASTIGTLPLVEGNNIYINMFNFASDSNQWSGYTRGTSPCNPAWLQLSADRK